MPENVAILRHGSGDDVQPRRSSVNAAHGSQVSLPAGNGPGGHALAALEPFASVGVIFAELARAAAPDRALADIPTTEPTFAVFCGAKVSSYCLRAPDRRATGFVP